MAAQDPRDAYLLAELGSTVLVLVEDLDSGKLPSANFIQEVREAVQRLKLPVPTLRPGD